MDLFQKLFF